MSAQRCGISVESCPKGVPEIKGSDKAVNECAI